MNQKTLPIPFRIANTTTIRNGTLCRLSRRGRANGTIEREGDKCERKGEINFDIVDVREECPGKTTAGWESWRVERGRVRERGRMDRYVEVGTTGRVCGR